MSDNLNVVVDTAEQTVTVNGLRFSAQFFEALRSAPVGPLLEVRRRTDGSVTLSTWRLPPGVLAPLRSRMAI